MRQDSDGVSWLLRTRPSLKRWSIEVREIVNGNREGYISYFGGAAEYVKSLLFNSRDTSSAEYFFEQALKNLTEAWHPLANPDTERDLRILQFLGAYTPSEGIGKVLILLGSFNPLDAKGGNSRTRKLRPIVLQVLEQYFPFEQPPPGAFAEYVAQLEAHLAYPAYATYAMARLRNLRKLTEDSPNPRLGVAIESAPGILPDLLGVLVPGLPENKQDLRVISAIYRHCLRVADNAPDLLLQFESAAELLGLDFVKDSAGPFLESPIGNWRQRIILDVEDFEDYYVKVHLPIDQKDVAEKLEEVQEKIETEEVPVSFELEVAA